MTADTEPAATGSALPGLLGRVDRLIARAEALILGAGVLLLALNTIANVVARFVFQNSLFFSSEVNRILIILITFAGIGYAARQGRHIRMSALYDALPLRLRKLSMLVIAFVTALVMFALCYFSVGYISKVAGSGRILPALQIPVYWVYLWVPVGFAVTGVQYLLTGIKNLQQGQVYLSTAVAEGYDRSNQELNQTQQE